MRVNLPVMCRVSGLVAVLVLAACDSPSPAFSRLPAQRVSVDGTEFSVRHTPFEAEAIRLTAGRPPTRGAIVLKGAKAIMRVTGCPVVPKSLEGDTTIVRANLDCPGTGPPPRRGTDAERFHCGYVGRWRKDGMPWASATIDCVRIR